MKLENYTIDSRKITFESGNDFEFDFPVKKSIQIEDKIIVLLDVLDNVIYNRNIFAIDSNAQIRWQIERSENLDLIGYCPFVSLDIIKGELVSFNWCGFRYTINSITGEITSMVFTK